MFVQNNLFPHVFEDKYSQRILRRVEKFMKILPWIVLCIIIVNS